jgi:hypothetical protein
LKADGEGELHLVDRLPDDPGGRWQMAKDVGSGITVLAGSGITVLAMLLLTQVVMAGLAYNCLNANASNPHVCDRVLGLVPSHALGVDKGHLVPDTTWPERKDGGESASNCGGGSRDTRGESGDCTAHYLAQLLTWCWDYKGQHCDSDEHLVKIMRCVAIEAAAKPACTPNLGVLSGVGRRSKTLRAAIEADEERDELVEQIEIDRSDLPHVGTSTGVVPEEL